MGLIILYFTGALALSFLCSVLEAVLLSTPMSFISMKENQGNKTASLMKRYKNNVDRPVGAILSLNTIAHTIGSAGVGAESIKLFGEEYFGVISAILTLLILVLSEIIPKTIGASYWRSLAMPSTKIIRVLISAWRGLNGRRDKDHDRSGNRGRRRRGCGHAGFCQGKVAQDVAEITLSP